MSRLICILCCVLFVPFYVFSENEKKEILEKIDSLTIANQIDSAICYLTVLQKELKTKTDSVLWLAYYDRQVLLARRLGDFAGSRNYSDTVAMLLPHIVPQTGTDSFYVARACSNLGALRSAQYNYSECIGLFKRSLSLTDNRPNEPFRSYFFQNLGLVYIRTGQVEQGLEYINDAFQIYDKSNDYEGKLGCADYIATVMVDYKNFHYAKKYFQIALSVLDSVTDMYARPNLYNDIGRMYNYKEEYDSAIVYFDMAQNEATKQNIGYLAAIIQCNKGEILIKQKKYADAEIQLREAIPLFDKLGFELGQFQAYNLMAYVCSKKNEQRLCNSYQKKAEGVLKNTIVDPSLLTDFYKRSYEIKKKQNATKQALDYLEKYQTLQDSLKDNLTSWRINELESRLMTSVKERQLAKKEQELLISRNHNYRIILVASIVFIFLLLLFWALAYRRKKEKQLFEAQKRIMAEEHEKSTLQMQLMLIRNRLSPHLVANLFLDLRQLVETGERQASLHLLDSISRLVVYTYTHTDSIMVSLRKELEFVKNYIEVRKMALETTFSYQIKVSEEALEINVPSMIIQLFVENAIKHGLLNKSGDRFLNIRSYFIRNSLCIEITDNGIGREKARKMRTGGTGMGFFILEKITDHLNALNRDSMKWKITDLAGEASEPVGTKVTIEIPKNYQYTLQ
ncbi:tetratricopeptide repeat-containing sensor histidine kinase [Maribellus maritimus]|uniref:tetratricopeptide repeat-containing sensor histidine kinase n=1 Tax=Maribellus maritimus TaxID=2870838 RepID=UPI001EECA348|nr:histidine kinase [Maribellus maritimus]MCG6191141.1 histidine kinase [Maribellus maritimus]